MLKAHNPFEGAIKMSVMMEKIKRWITPATILFFLSPMVAELLTGSTPPRQFINPFVLLLLAGLYGSGAIIVRELSLRWRSGWAGRLALGAAYGVVEEGIAVKSWFDPKWPGVGLYSRWLGMNWAWAISLTVFHSVFSIAIPIMLVEIGYPKLRDQSWVSRRALIGLGFIFAADVIFDFLFISHYHPPIILLLFAAAIVLILIWIAYRLPYHPSALAQKRARRSVLFWVIGFVGTLGFFVISWGTPHTAAPPILEIVALILYGAAIAWGLHRITGSGGNWSDRHKLALAAGALSFFIALDPLFEHINIAHKNEAGLTLIGLGCAAALIVLNYKVKGCEFGAAE